MLKRTIILLMATFLLTGCTTRQAQEEISFASWGSVTEVGVLKQVISDFEQENPEIKINFMHIPQNYFQKLHLLFASNCAPDVIFINNLYLPLYKSKLEILSNYVDKNEFYPQSIEALSDNENLYAIPRDISNLVLYINQDKVSKTEFSSLGDLLNTAVQSSNNEIFGISYEEDIYWILPYLAYYGEEFNEKFNPDKSNGLKLYKDLREKYKVAPTKSQVGSSTLAQMFLDEKLAIYLSGRWMYPKISEKADFNWRVSSFPIGKSKFLCDSSGWAIAKESKHKSSAIKFIKYLSGEKSAEYFVQTGLVVPARIKSAQKLNNNVHNEKVFLEMIENSTANIVSKDYKKMSDKFNEILR